MVILREILSAANQKLKDVSEERESLDKKLIQLGRDQTRLINIKEAIGGLERTKKEKSDPNEYFDLGKDDTAYFYCSSIGEDDIGHSEKPDLEEACPDCGVKVPVLMSYEQTYNSPQLDMWAKTAFTVCVCGNYNEIKNILKKHRFF